MYATSVGSNAVLSFHRNRSTGALTQLGGGAGCITNATAPGCVVGRALDGPDSITVSPDGKNVYVVAFTGSSVAVFTRNPSTGALTQPSDSHRLSRRDRDRRLHHGPGPGQSRRCGGQP